MCRQDRIIPTFRRYFFTLLQFRFTTIFYYRHQNICQKASSIIYYLQTKCDKQVPELNSLQIIAQNNSILKSCQKERQLKEDSCCMINKQVSTTNSCSQDKHDYRKYVSINNRFTLIVQRIENSRHHNKSKNYCKYQDKHKNLLSFVILVEN